MPSTNLSAPLGSPMAVLASQSEFIALSGGMPTAHVERVGVLWLGLQGTFGSLSKASYKETGEIKETPGNSPGTSRSAVAVKLGKEVEFEMSWDRGQPDLALLDRFAVWLDGPDGRELVYLHVTALGGDYGADDRVSRKVTGVHTPGIDDQTALQRAMIDGLGRVISHSDQLKFEAQADDPAGALPTGPEGSYSVSWARSGTTVTVTTSAAHGWSTGQNVVIYQSSSVAATPLGTESITVVDATHFTFTGVAAGATSGTLTLGAA